MKTRRCLVTPRLRELQFSKHQSKRPPRSPPRGPRAQAGSSAPCPGGLRVQAVPERRGSGSTEQPSMPAKGLGSGPSRPPRRSAGQSASGDLSCRRAVRGGSLSRGAGCGTEQSPAKGRGSGALPLLPAHSQRYPPLAFSSFLTHPHTNQT